MFHSSRSRRLLVPGLSGSARGERGRSKVNRAADDRRGQDIIERIRHSAKSDGERWREDHRRPHKGRSRNRGRRGGGSGRGFLLRGGVLSR